MIQAILSGCHGAMGKTIYQASLSSDKIAIVAGYDRTPSTEFPFPVYTNFSEMDCPADLVIDFSHANALTPLLDFCIGRKLPLVIATTGYTPAQKEEIIRASQEIPIFFTANMSLGINLLSALVKQAALLLGESFDIEIVEKHHNQKLDAPSGTALLLAEEISSAFPQPRELVYDRHIQREKRRKEEIGIHSIRGGSIVGEHDVIFAGLDETITLSHQATSKAVFASGAIRAACYLIKEFPGMYDMHNLLAEELP